MRLEDKVTIITGGSRGIGKAISLTFASEGAKIAVVSRNKPDCDAVVSEISKIGGEAISIQADVSSEANVTEVVNQTQNRFHRIDILVNCAAVTMPERPVTELSLKDWNLVIGVNLTGTFLCCRAVLPQMIAQQHGKIINFSSIGGRRGKAGRSAYRASKAAVINFTECLAAEVKEFSIDVNAICPGAVETDMFRYLSGNKVPKWVMPPEDIAAVALFLASDESRVITGTAIDAFGPSNPLFGV
ncbi:SDR family NAD(P)-dependent oxidoreductase [Chloroflexota bacterium]